MSAKCSAPDPLSSGRRCSNCARANAGTTTTVDLREIQVMRGWGAGHRGFWPEKLWWCWICRTINHGHWRYVNAQRDRPKRKRKQ